MLKDDYQPGFENLFLLLLPLSGVPYVPRHKTLLSPFHLLSSAIHLFFVVWPLCTVIDHEDITLNSRASAIIIICGLEELIIMTWQQQWQRKMAMDLKVNLAILRLMIFPSFPVGGGWWVIEGVVCRIFVTPEGHEKGALEGKRGRRTQIGKSSMLILYC